MDATDKAKWRAHLRRQFGDDELRDRRFDAIDADGARKPVGPTPNELDQAHRAQANLGPHYTRSVRDFLADIRNREFIDAETGEILVITDAGRAELVRLGLLK